MAKPDHPAPAFGEKPLDETKRTGSGKQWSVTFPGYAPVVVEAANAEDALKVAKEQMGIVATEKPADVVEVKAPPPPVEAK